MMKFKVDHFDKNMKEKLEFFKNVPLLKSWPIENVSALVRNVEIVKFKHGQVIFKQDSEVKDLFFVKSGTVEVNNWITRISRFLFFVLNQLTKNIEVDICNIDQSFVNSPIFKKVNHNDVKLFKSINPHWKRKIRKKECLRVLNFWVFQLNQEK